MGNTAPLQTRVSFGVFVSFSVLNLFGIADIYCLFFHAIEMKSQLRAKKI